MNQLALSSDDPDSDGSRRQWVARPAGSRLAVVVGWTLVVGLGGAGPRLFHQVADEAWRQRTVPDLDPERAQRVLDRGRDHGGHPERPGLTRALDPERVERAEGLLAVQLDPGDLPGRWDRVVEVAGGQRGAIVGVERLLVQRVAEPVCDAAQ